jgi:hypothetical protein
MGAAMKLTVFVVDSPTLPPVVYHFTDVAGLVAIVESKAIWATLATSLNDASEGSYALELAEKAVSEFDDAPLFANRVKEFLNPSADAAQRAVWYPFVASFCARADSALHWLHYGRQGTGVALGFRTEQLESSGFELLQVLYDPNEQKALVHAVLKNVIEALRQTDDDAVANPENGWFDVAAHITASFLRATAPFLKSPAFEAEQEWRLMNRDFEAPDASLLGDLYPDIGRRCRVRGSRLVAYKAIPYATLPLSEGILGAACETPTDDLALRHLLPGVVIKRSHVRVRP